MDILSDNKLIGIGLGYILGAIIAGLVLHYLIRIFLKKGYFFKDKEQIETVSQPLISNSPHIVQRNSQQTLW